MKIIFRKQDVLALLALNSQKIYIDNARFVQVKEMKSNWDRKEREIISERDKAVAAASSAVEKLKETEEKLQREVKETKDKFEGERLELVNSCDGRIEEIENEMRQMLKEHEGYRKMMESKFNKLHSAISDFQSHNT